PAFYGLPPAGAVSCLGGSATGLTPQAFKVVEVPGLIGHNVDHYVDQVDQRPVGRRPAFGAVRTQAGGFGFFFHITGYGGDMTVGGTGGDNHPVGDGGTAANVEDGDIQGLQVFQGVNHQVFHLLCLHQILSIELLLRDVIQHRVRCQKDDIVTLPDSAAQVGGGYIQFRPVVQTDLTGILCQ